MRTAVRTAFQNLTDPANPGKQVVLKIMNKEELRDVDGSDSLHPNRSGDVVVVLRPPYQSDAGTAGQAVALSHFFGQHGYLPNYVDMKNNINMHATFVAGGPGIKKKDNVKDLRAIDVAPTIAFLMDIPGPAERPRADPLRRRSSNRARCKEVTILDISDFHGQLIPLARGAGQPRGPASTPTFAIGGSAYLKKWFEIYEAEAALDGTKTLASSRWRPATRSAPRRRSRTSSATSRRSKVMNMMGIDIDGAREPQLRPRVGVLPRTS